MMATHPAAGHSGRGPCFLGTIRRLGFHSRFGASVPEPVRFAWPNLVGSGAVSVHDLCHPPSGFGRRGAGLAWRFGAASSEIRGDRDLGLLAVFLARGV